jgi:hypothetical protein
MDRRPKTIPPAGYKTTQQIKRIVVKWQDSAIGTINQQGWLSLAAFHIWIVCLF